MTPQLLINIAVAAVLILWIGSRQLTWRPLDAARLWTIPVVLTLGGLVVMANQAEPGAFTPLALGIVAAELVVSVVIGVIMGRLAHFRRGADGRRETRTGWIGMALWIVLIGARIGADIWAAGTDGAALAASTGAILFVIGLNRVSRSATLAYRASRLRVAPADEPRMMVG
jgi:hypothetical protein